nr:DUF1476 domain-containing protein [uncultured Cohaesibacter sp.]
MTTFDNREAGYEAKFAHDQEVIFKATVRRNKMIGHWVAEELGYAEEAAERYVENLVRSCLKKADDDAVVDRILEDFRSHDLVSSEHRIRQKLSRLMSVALVEMTAEA